jgi:hypothetical protein
MAKAPRLLAGQGSRMEEIGIQFYISNTKMISDILGA